MISQAELSIFIEIPPVLSLARNKGQRKGNERTEKDERSVAAEGEKMQNPYSFFLNLIY